MSHTAAGGELCLTASALVFTDGSEPRVLLHQHKTYPVVIQPGGHVDPGELPWAAVLRELSEEAGIGADQLYALSPLPFTPAPGRFPAPLGLDVHQLSAEATHTDLVFAFVIDGPPREQPGPGESSQLLWLTAAEVAEDSRVPQQVAELVAALQVAVESWHRVPVVEVGLAARPWGR